MARYQVVLSVIILAEDSVIVEADGEEDAVHKALEMAGDLEFDPVDAVADIRVEAVTRL